MITASDVLEDMKSLSGEFQNSEADVLIFAHLSSVEVGTHHGVFVMDKATNQLKRVLQKPSIEEMRQEGAIRSDGMVLTDSCYFMTWKFCRKLLKNPLLRKPVNEELCCYGDFMRPMGEDPKIDYIQNCASGRSTYRKALADAFKTARVEIAELGLNSFFHFGTYQEFTEHLLPKSQFRAAFPNFYKSNIVRSRGFSNVPLSSFVEFSDGHGVQVGENCVVSCVRAPEFSGAKIPENTVVFGVIMEEERKFVTVMLDVREDIKKRWEIVKWNGHDTGIANASLWEAPIFEICETLEESLHKTLNEWGNGLKVSEAGISCLKIIL
uniref:Fucokinase domain-containing protein n=1 Tax=Caenorhabditis japonica TaxID=281687 RepID=A0A8R1E2B6_CAEJA